MNEVIYLGTVSTVSPVVQAFPVDDDTLMILEKLPVNWIDEKDRTPPDSGLVFKTFDVQEDFETWGQGRIFNPTAELRWEKNGVGFHVVYIGPPGALPGLTVDDTIKPEETDRIEAGYYLWGQRMSKGQLEDIGWDPTATDIFVELKTPRLLHYPAQVRAGSRLKLQVTEYYDRQTGQLMLYRLKGVEAA